MEHPLRQFRKSKGISLDAAATALGVSKATLSRFETSKQHISSALFIRIAEWTDGTVTPNDLFDFKRKHDEAA